MAAARPLVSVRKIDVADQTADQVVLPAVFLAPVRPDIVHFVHTSMAKNRRQAYAVSAGAGHQHSAESWGTGRAVARIPRVSGGGTSRAGQGAFGNQCRKGRMFAPTKTWRRWHRKINLNQKRFAVASALAASAIPALVMARGHRVEQIPEVPLVLDDACQSVTKTKQAINILKTVGAFEDVEKAKASRQIHAGVGKRRNRRHVMRRGPLVVYEKDNGICRAFRNLPGVELVHVDNLNLLQLAPGGHLGRFCIWTKSAMQKLNDNWGSTTRPSANKKGYYLPRSTMTNSDVSRIINSEEIQSVLRSKRHHKFFSHNKKNALKNFGTMVKLNPYAVALRRQQVATQAASKAAPVAKKNTKESRQAFEAIQKQSKKNYSFINDDETHKLVKKQQVEEVVEVQLLANKKRRRERLVDEPKAAAPAAPAAAAAAPAKKK